MKQKRFKNFEKVLRRSNVSPRTIKRALSKLPSLESSQIADLVHTLENPIPESAGLQLADNSASEAIIRKLAFNMKTRKANGKAYSLFLGAGASTMSGVGEASQIGDQILADLYRSILPSASIAQLREHFEQESEKIFEFENVLEYCDLTNPVARYSPMCYKARI